MTISADEARDLSVKGRKTQEAKRALERIAEARELEARAQEIAIYAREKLDYAIEKSAEKGGFRAYVWFPEPSNVMRRVATIIGGDYTAAGYDFHGARVEDSRHFNKYGLTLKWS